MKQEAEEITFIRSSGNVFADLGIDNAQEELDKSRVARAIRRQIKARGLTQLQAANIMGTSQPKVSEIIGGKLEDFTLDRLIRYSRALECRVDVVTYDSQGVPEYSEHQQTRTRAEPEGSKA